MDITGYHGQGADIYQAATLAGDELLGGAHDEIALVRIAIDLKELATAYSTHELAASVALNVLRNTSPPNRRDALARMTVREWSREGKIAPALAKAFENSVSAKALPQP
jgi:hypothetical protein